MATPTIRSIWQHFPQTRIIGVCRPYVADVIAGSPWFDTLIFHEKRAGFQRSDLGVAWQLRKWDIDAAVLFPNSFRSAAIAWLGGCRQRIGFDRYGRGVLLTHRLFPLRGAYGRPKPTPIINDYAKLVAPLGVPAPSRRMELFTTWADERAADAVWHACGWKDSTTVVCFNPGAAFGAAKHWPSEAFARLARRFVYETGHAVLILCGPKERDLARQIAELAHAPNVHSLADFPLSLGLTKACIRRCALLVTTDSGPRHFAAAFQRPVVSLFGPTHIDWTETYYDQAIHLQKKVPCGPCQLRVCPLDHRCMRELSVEEVFSASLKLLSPLAPPREVRHAG